MSEEILEITKKFHDTYEKLASEYAYETRKDTRVFDINSNNGKLMYATVNEIVSSILEENKKLNGTIQTYDILLKANVEENKQLKEKLNCDLQWAFKYEKQVDNWNKLKKNLKEWKENEEYCYLASSPIDRCRKDIYGEILNKMQELERSDSDGN